MRDNGLTAAAYTCLGGIDPLVAEPVLAALADAGIAAYAAEPGGEAPAGREEIFVDAGSAGRARAVIDRSTQDAEWASLVEQYDAPSAPGHPESPASPEPRRSAGEDAEPDAGDSSDEPSGDGPAGSVADERRPTRSNDPHDHYIPPEPARGPRLDWISRAAWLGAVGGPLLLVLAALLDFGAGRITLIAVLAFAAGFLTLVVRMKERLPGDDHGDDGAVV